MRMASKAMYVLSYLALQGADKEGLEGFAGLVRVTDILESLGGVLASDVKKDLLTTAVYHERKKNRSAHVSSF